MTFQIYGIVSHSYLREFGMSGGKDSIFAARVRKIRNRDLFKWSGHISLHLYFYLRYGSVDFNQKEKITRT